MTIECAAAEHSGLMIEKKEGRKKGKKKERKKLENVAIAYALQLEAARATPTPSSFNYDAMPSLMSLNLSIAVL